MTMTYKYLLFTLIFLSACRPQGYIDFLDRSHFDNLVSKLLVPQLKLIKQRYTSWDFPESPSQAALLFYSPLRSHFHDSWSFCIYSAL